jgi:hypothetical protein
VTQALARWLRAFGRFWWDFLVGDTPELTVAALLVVAAAYALASSRVAAVVVLPALAVCALVASTVRGRVRR